MHNLGISIQNTTTHELMFSLCRIVNLFQLKFSNFPASSVTGPKRFVLFWEAGSISKKNGSKSLAYTCDQVLPNRKLLTMHSHIKNEGDINPDVDVTNGTVNQHKSENAYLFFSEFAHLIETTCSCLVNSPSGSQNRYTQNNVMFIICSHISNLLL